MIYRSCCIALFFAGPLFAAEPLRPDQPVQLFNNNDLTGLTTWLKDTKNALHVTVLHLLGLDDTRLTYFHEGRFNQLSQTGGQVIREVLG